MLKEQVKKLIILKALEENPKTKEDFLKIERKVIEKFKSPFLFNFADLLKTYKKLLKKKKIQKNENLENILKTSSIRSLSGIVSITVLTKPYPCPGKCLYCPTVNSMPKSYLPDEPACKRALDNNFNPYKQMLSRINALKATGHNTDKIELIVLGGTFSFYPKNYQLWFVKRCFEAANQKNSKTLKETQKNNEKTKNRIVGLTIETRPDFINQKELWFLRKLGVTRVELGVQATDDEILRKNQRNCYLKDIIQATKLLKNAGFKVTYHMMLNLYGSNPLKDEQMFEELFSKPEFQPDQLKIYPCVVLKDSPLFNFYLNKEYQPYKEEELIDLLIKIKEKIPPYVRIIRIIRDIPSNDIIAGNKTPNLRQIIAFKMQQENKKCRCLRCREPRETPIDFENVKLVKREYEASNGKEIFLSFEDFKNDKVLSFLRLRLTNEWTFPFLKDSALIRELHSYGLMAPLKSQKSNVQHKGLGKKLLEEAEKIVKKETNFKKIFIISGVGVREYYRKLGYRLFKTYMAKKIK
jgi:elongator complex protein 3